MRNDEYIDHVMQQTKLKWLDPDAQKYPKSVTITPSSVALT